MNLLAGGPYETVELVNHHRLVLLSKQEIFIPLLSVKNGFGPRLNAALDLLHIVLGLLKMADQFTHKVSHMLDVRPDS